MKNLLLTCCSLLAASCGLENFASNVAHQEDARPASAIQGKLPWPDGTTVKFSVSDADGNAVTPFQTSYLKGAYDVRLPSGKYAFLIVSAQAGDVALQALVPSIGEEVTLKDVDMDAKSTAEALIFVARLTHDKLKAAQLTPGAYSGNGVTTGTRAIIRRTLDQPGDQQTLVRMIQRVAAVAHLEVSSDPGAFLIPAYDGDWKVKSRAVDPGWLVRQQLDYTGDGKVDHDTVAFDETLALAASPKSFDPRGCPDPANVRVVFSADFTGRGKDGNGNTPDRFKWAVDKPGKSMFFVGWVHRDSPFNDPAANNRLGGSVPNTIPMHDDGTNGDEVAGDGIWTFVVDLPRNLRVGYKYTWGTRGAVWTGSEEWPGNSRILEVVDVNGDALVYRHDVFADEATNKDRANQFAGAANTTGAITWTTDLHGCGPESHEQPFDYTDADASRCTQGTWLEPKAVGPLTVACPIP